MKIVLTMVLHAYDQDLKKTIDKLPEAKHKTGRLGDKVYWRSDLLKLIKSK